jgi:hypothetical protein
MLFAYLVNGNDLRIADVDFLNGTGAGNTTAGQTIVASDVADLGTGVSLLGLGLNAVVQFHTVGA